MVNLLTYFIHHITEEDRQSFNRLKSLQIQRGIIKKTIMTIPYNVSSIQGIKYLKESFEYDQEYTDSMKTLLTEEMKILDKENEHILQIEKNNVNNKVNETNEWNCQDNSSISMIDDILNMNITHTHTNKNLYYDW